MTAKVEKTIDVDVPVSTAYNQWTQFETFPEFMEGVAEVRQLSDTTLHWKASVGGVEKEWDAEITEQTPDQRIAWRAIDGAPNAGVVTFHRLGERQSRVALQLEAEPEGLVEQVGDKLGVFDRRVEGDLKRFKDFVETRGDQTGAWRGEVEPPRS
ncbi:MAG: SRPBCC family protein [Candidatus Dormibacteria bacterium]